MAQHEDHFTVFIRLPFSRGDFVDPPPVAWSASKERDLWEILSRQSKGNEIDWKTLSDQFQVTQSFLLQQAAWLYERQLSQVRAQMRRMGNRSSNTASPAPGSTAVSMLREQTSRRSTITSSRTPSRLATQMTPTLPQQEGSAPNTPLRSRTSLPFRTPSDGVVTHARGGSTTSRPLSRQSSKDNEGSSRTHSRRGSVQHQQTRSPALTGPSQADLSSEEELAQSKLIHRRPNPSASRRNAPVRKSQYTRPAARQVEEDDDEDTPAFLPYAPMSPRDGTSSSQDQGATLKGGLPQARRPSANRRTTSERITSSTGIQQSKQPQRDLQLTSSTSSNSASEHPTAMPATTGEPSQPFHTRQPSSQGRNQMQGNLPNPLSPRQQAALAAAAGLSPRRRSTNPTSTQAGSDTSPSMGSSFSDLDDASVTQSALEEALMSGLGNTTMTVAGNPGNGAGVGAGVASRVSGISQALRSRYFDTRSGNGGGGGGLSESQR